MAGFTVGARHKRQNNFALSNNILQSNALPYRDHVLTRPPEDVRTSPEGGPREEPHHVDRLPNVSGQHLARRASMGHDHYHNRSLTQGASPQSAPGRNSATGPVYLPTQSPPSLPVPPEHTEAIPPNAFKTNENTWSFVFLFPPPLRVGLGNVPGSCGNRELGSHDPQILTSSPPSCSTPTIRDPISFGFGVRRVVFRS